MTHDYKRHGTTSLSVAMDVASGGVVSETYRRHPHQELLRLLRKAAGEVPRNLRINIILNNYSTHGHRKVRELFAELRIGAGHPQERPPDRGPVPPALPPRGKSPSWNFRTVTATRHARAARTGSRARSSTASRNGTGAPGTGPTRARRTRPASTFPDGRAAGRSASGRRPLVRPARRGRTSRRRPFRRAPSDRRRPPTAFPEG